jgi:hypothetical protein
MVLTMEVCGNLIILPPVVFLRDDSFYDIKYRLGVSKKENLRTESIVIPFSITWTSSTPKKAGPTVTTSPTHIGLLSAPLVPN